MGKLIRFNDGQSDIDRPRSEPKLKLASSLQDARVGELMLLDNEGQVLDPRRRRWHNVTSWSIWLGMSAALAVTWGLLVESALLGGLLGAWFVATPFLRVRTLRRVQRAVALVAAGERDRARVAIDELLSKNTPKAYFPTLLFLRSKLAWQSGDHKDALDRYTNAMQRLHIERHPRNRVLYWACAFDRIQLLAVMGDIERARAAREEAEAAPHGDYFYMERMLADLMIGFHSDSLEPLPDIETLYDWAKDALRTNQFGLAVVLLAWAFDRHGEDEMTEHLLAEAPERLRATFFVEAVPAVHAWMQERVRDIAPADDEWAALEAAVETGSELPSD